MKRLFLLGYCLLGWGAVDTFSQQNFVVSGGEATGPGGSVSFSIGQITYVAASSADHIIIQGIQQSGDDLNVSIEETDIILSAIVYPNPAREFLTLKVETGKFEDLTFWLYTEQGKLLLNQRIVGNETYININHLPTAKYFVKISGDNKVLKTFKIIKL